MAREAVTSVEDVDRLFKKRESNRPIYWFRVPKAIADTTGVEKVGLVELFASEELMATRRGDGDQVKMALELAKACVRFVNDERISDADGTSDSFWSSEKAGQAFLRKLVVSAFSELHNPKQDEVDDFLASRTIAVG